MLVLAAQAERIPAAAVTAVKREPGTLLAVVKAAERDSIPMQAGSGSTKTDQAVQAQVREAGLAPGFQEQFLLLVRRREEAALEAELALREIQEHGTFLAATPKALRLIPTPAVSG
jgi:hypothetical protein